MMTASMRCAFRYSRESFLAVKSKRCFGLQRNLRRYLFYLGISRHCQKIHEERPSAIGHIPVRISHRDSSLPEKRMSRAIPSALRPIPRAPRHLNSHHHQLRMGLLNVRSLNNKTDDVLELQRDNDLDILLLVETWHDTDSVCMRRLRKKGFTISDRPRPRASTPSLSTNHGGVAILSTSRILHAPVNLNIEFDSFEAVCTRISTGASQLVIILIYRTGPITTTFFNELSEVLNTIATFRAPLLVAGDLNIHVERDLDNHSRTLIDLMASYNLTCRVDAPTHDLGGTLDVVFTQTDLPARVTTSHTGLSDHLLLTWAAPLPRPSRDYIKICSRPWHRLDINELRLLLCDSLICRPDSWPQDVDDLASIFDSTLIAILDSLIPSRTLTLRRRPSDPWFDDECRRSKRHVRRLERQCLRLRAPSTHPKRDSLTTSLLLWKEASKNYRSLLRRKRETFWRTKVSDELKSPRSLWKSINTLLGRGPISPSTHLTAADLHDFFDSKVSQVRDSTTPTVQDTCPSAVLNERFRSFTAISSQSVAAIIRALPDKCSASDPLRTRVLKDCVDLLVPFLSHMFNLSLSSGVFPAQWKASVVTPKLKKSKSDVNDPSSYRPISNLPVLSKVLERIVSAQLRSYLSSNNLLPSLQSGYRPNHSTETALLKVTCDILRDMDNGHMCLLSFLDLSSAFDTVDHHILLRRLFSSFGLNDRVLDWFSSFVLDRTMSVRFDNVKTTPRAVSCGVPQGSVLGPLLFVMYVVDVIPIVQDHLLKVHMFADDLQIYGSCRPNLTSVLSTNVSCCLDAVISWCSSNRLLINPAKSEIMWCASLQRKANIPVSPIRVGSSLVSPASSVRCLGVTLDSHLSFDQHITRTISMCFSLLRQIRSVRRSLTRPLLRSAVSALVLSRLDFGLSLLSGSTTSRLRRLQLVLHASARLLHQVPRSAHITPLLRDLCWLPIESRIASRLATLVLSCRLGLGPTYLRQELHSVADQGGRARLRSAATSSLIVPFSRHPTLGGRSFASTAARTWNSLPPSLQSIESLRLFKVLIKSHFLDKF